MPTTRNRDVQLVRQRALLSANLDGPRPVDPDGEYAVCLTCGAMVMLGDRAEGIEPYERGVKRHAEWHARLG